MVKPLYHLHMDAAYMPAPLMDKLIKEAGFHFDDFPHQLEVNGEKMEARHLTKYIYAPVSADEIKEECEKLQSWATDFHFVGLIQCEYVMEDTQFGPKQTTETRPPSPFKIETRPLTHRKGDQFKKHELHLEINKSATNPGVIEALKGCGMHELENARNITFTASGHSKEMLKIRKMIKKFLTDNPLEVSGQLTYEATAFWSLHGIKSESLPLIVDKVTLLS